MVFFNFFQNKNRDVYNECKNFTVFKGHTNAILELHWSTDGSRIYTASADKSLGVWEVETGKSLKKFQDDSFVNSCHPARRGPDLIVTGNDDGIFLFLNLILTKVLLKFGIQDRKMLFKNYRLETQNRQLRQYYFKINKKIFF